MDRGSIIGIPLSITGVITCLYIEGLHANPEGSFMDFMQLIMGGPAFMLIVGGSFGATMLEMPWHITLGGLKAVKKVFLGDKQNFQGLVDQIVKLATVARKDGLLALEKERESIDDPLLKEAVRFAIDGLEPNLVQQILESRIAHKNHENGLCAKFWSQMGAYCPTVGILGAVLGLILVMQQLDNPDAIGPGIGVAFIATIYGVGLSNLVMLPIGGKLKNIYAYQELYYEMIQVGVKDIQLGTSPSIISSHLMAIIDETPPEEE